jgi:N4-gp56 family major capsid protein
MTQTTAANMIDPDVWADMMQAEFTGRLIFGQDGGAFATVDSTLEGAPGSKISTAKWGKLGDADELADLTETAALVPDVLDSTPDESAVIKEAGRAAEVTDRALLIGYGDPLAEVRRQFGTMTTRKVDSDLYAVAKTGAGLTLDKSASTDGLAFTVADALGKFGDDAEPGDFAGYVIHSRQRTAAFKDDSFISADKYGAGQVVVRGEIGNVYGVPIIVSDRVTFANGTDATAGTADDLFDNLLVKKGALWLLYKRRPVVEQDRDILARSTVVTTNVHYAVDLFDANGVCKVTAKAQAQAQA